MGGGGGGGGGRKAIFFIFEGEMRQKWCYGKVSKLILAQIVVFFPVVYDGLSLLLSKAEAICLSGGNFSRIT